MKKTGVLPSLMLAAVFLGCLAGCEDEPSMGNLDRYFEEHPFVSDPRKGAFSPLRLYPDTAQVSFVGQTVTFRVAGGSSYTWDVAVPTRGTIVTTKRTDTAIYTAAAVADNTVIVYDRSGLAAIAEITRGTPQILQILPKPPALDPFIRISANTPIGGILFDFQGVGGIPPYTWSRSDATLGSIDANGRYVVAVGGPREPTPSALSIPMAKPQRLTLFSSRSSTKEGQDHDKNDIQSHRGSVLCGPALGHRVQRLLPGYGTG